MKVLKGVNVAARQYGRLSDGTEVLTAYQLRECYENLDRIERTELRLSKEGEALERELPAFQSAFRDIEEAGRTLDLTSQNAVDAHNRQVAELQVRATSIQARAEDLESEARELELIVAQFNRQCGGKSYYEEDAVRMQAEMAGP